MCDGKIVECRIRESIDSLSHSLGEEYERNLKSLGEPPWDLWNNLSQLGYVGIGIPEKYGGGGAGLWGLSVVCEQLARNGHLPVMLVMSPGIVDSILLGGGTEEQKENFLPGITNGSIVFSFAITESEAGSNTRAIKTTLTSVHAGYYRLRGEKCFISGVEQATHILVVARMSPSEGGEGGLVTCIVGKEDPGISLQKIQTKQFSSDSQWIVTFNDVKVVADRIIDDGVSGLKNLFLGLNPERILMASFCNGIALRAIDLASSYARGWKVWGSPIAVHQAVAHPLAKAKIEVELARLAVEKSVRDEGSVEFANYAKYAAAEAAISAVDHAIEVHGGNGFTDDYPVSDLYWPARLLGTAPVSAEMILNYVAHNVLDLPRSY